MTEIPSNVNESLLRSYEKRIRDLSRLGIRAVLLEQTAEILAAALDASGALVAGLDQKSNFIGLSASGPQIDQTGADRILKDRFSVDRLMKDRADHQAPLTLPTDAQPEPTPVSWALAVAVTRGNRVIGALAAFREDHSNNAGFKTFDRKILEAGADFLADRIWSQLEPCSDPNPPSGEISPDRPVTGRLQTELDQSIHRADSSSQNGHS